jgi:hypothetical protein
MGRCFPDGPLELVARAGTSRRQSTSLPMPTPHRHYGACACVVHMGCCRRARAFMITLQSLRHPSDYAHHLRRAKVIEPVCQADAF